MELNTLISQFFTDEEVKRAFTSICGTVEDGGYLITKYSVIDEFDEPLQRICDFINELQNHINNLIVTRNIPIIETIEECKRDTVSKPFLPSSLDEAAHKYAWEKQENHIDFDGEEYLDYGPRYDAFKAGAEWKEEQMLENAVETYIIKSYNPCTEGSEPSLHGIELLYEDKDKPYLLAGQKARIVVLKKEEQYETRRFD